MYGNNAGLLRDARHAPWLLQRFAGVTGGGGLIVASTLDPYDTTDTAHRDYHRGTDGAVAWVARSGYVRASSGSRRHGSTTSSRRFGRLERLVVEPAGTLDDVIDGAGPTYAFVLRKA